MSFVLFGTQFNIPNLSSSLYYKTFNVDSFLNHHFTTLTRPLEEGKKMGPGNPTKML